MVLKELDGSVGINAHTSLQRRPKEAHTGVLKNATLEISMD